MTRYLEVRRHTMRSRPDERLTAEGLALAAAVGAGIGPFAKVVSSTRERAYQTALAMGFRQVDKVEGIASMGDDVDAEIQWDAGFAAFAGAYGHDGAVRRYGNQIANLWRNLARCLPDGQAALIITHGGIIEAGTAALYDQAANLGPFCHYCEGVRLEFEDGKVTRATALRVV